MDEGKKLQAEIEESLGKIKENMEKISTLEEILEKINEKGEDK